MTRQTSLHMIGRSLFDGSRFVIGELDDESGGKKCVLQVHSYYALAVFIAMGH